MEVILNQHLFYSNREPIPAREVAEALLAFERIVKLSPAVLNKLFPEAQIRRTEVYINELHSGSLYEDVVVKFVFGNQERLDAFIDNVRERVGMDEVMSDNNVFAAILIAMMLVGGSYWLSRSGSGNDAPISQIEANNNVVINVGAGALEMDVSELRTVIEGALPDKRRLARDAATVLRPARRDPEATITFNDNDQLRIQSETIQAIPATMGGDNEEGFIEDYEDVLVEIRAVDLDSHKRGWAAVVPMLGQSRVRLQLDMDVNPDHLMLHPQVRADITVMFDVDEDGEARPKLVFLRALSDRT